MLQNVRLLKWAHYYGIKVAWNLLTGFPGETERGLRAAGAANAAARAPAARRPAAARSGWSASARTSPKTRSRSRDVEPWKAYSYVYPPELDVRKIAYFFTYTMGDVVPEESLTDVNLGIERWQKRWAASPKRPLLVYQRAPDWIQIVDQRDAEETEVHSFQGLTRPPTSCAATSERRRGSRRSSTRLQPTWRARCGGSATAA